MVKIGINGMGRIGRALVRGQLLRPNPALEIAAVNNPGTMDRYVHLLKYDSVHGRLPEGFSLEGDARGNLLLASGPEGTREIPFRSEASPKDVPWDEDGVEIVVDATGKFRDRASLEKHLGGGVRRAILCAPGKDLDATCVMGINHRDYDPALHRLVSNASCTTNCLAPVAKVLHDRFGIENGFATTVHSYTSDQKLLDGSHGDFRRARAAALSMIPTTTGAAKAVGLVIPALAGKLDGSAIRVPTPNVSMVDFCCLLSKGASREDVNAAFKEAAAWGLAGILACEEEPLVSADYVGLRASACVDLPGTNVSGRLVRVAAWYDNEVGFSNRVLELAAYMGGK